MTNDEILDIGLAGLASCGHANDEEIGRVRTDKKSVLYAQHEEGGYGPEHSMSALVELTDGTYAVIYEEEDSTGHGCQCNGSLQFFPDLGEAVRLGLGQNDRDTFLRGAIGRG